MGLTQRFRNELKLGDLPPISGPHRLRLRFRNERKQLAIHSQHT